MEKVIKRDGRVVLFDASKIVDAIEKAMDRTDRGIDAAQALYIAAKIAENKDDMSVEAIQDKVEEMLMSSDRKDVAREYIIYRSERTKQREMNSSLTRKVFEKTDGKNIENANANVDEATFGGRKQEATSIIQKIIALEMNMSPDVAAAHKDGWVYHHDLDSFNVGMHNCLFIDFKRLFRYGFTTRNGDVRPPNSFSTGCQQMAVGFQIQSQCQYGGVASAHADFDLAPLVAKSFYRHFCDGLTYVENLDFWQSGGNLSTGVTSITIGTDDQREQWAISLSNKKLSERFPKAWKYATDMLEREGKQAAQGLYHNLNTLESRAGSQVPFTSLNFGRDTSIEGRMVTRWLLEASIEGIGAHHVTSIFPISIFVLKKGVNMYPGDPNYDLKCLAMKSMSKRIYPNFAFGDWSEAHEVDDDPDTYMATINITVA